MSYSLFAVGGTQWLRQNGARTMVDKGKRAALPDIPSERSGSSPLFFAVQRRKARREGGEGAFVILNDALSKDQVLPCSVGFDRLLIAKTTTFKQCWNGAKKSQLHAIGKRASEHHRCLSTLINPDRQKTRR